MAKADTVAHEGDEQVAPKRRRHWLRVLLALMLVVVALVAAVWFSRERIAGNIIASQLEDYGIPATYDIDTISSDRQVLKNIVIGDPRHPDMTIANAEVSIRYRIGMPTLGRVTLVSPRVYGTYRGGKLSFGALDKVLFSDTGKTPGLPALDVRLIDGRGLIESEFGPVGIKIEGQGALDSGFKGLLAAVAPQVDGGGCNGKQASIYGVLTTDSGKPHFAGPVRLARLSCPEQGLTLEKAVLAVDVTGDSDLAGFDGRARLETDALAASTMRANGINGNLRATWRKQAVTAKYTLAARGVAMPQAHSAVMTFDGSLRAASGFDRIDIRSSVAGSGVRMGPALDDMLAGAVRRTQGTLVAPLLSQARIALLREGRASRFVADLSARRTGKIANIVIPQASLKGGSGATLLSVSQVQLSGIGNGPLRFSGNLATGGSGLPKMTGRMERGPGGRAVLRLRMADYSAGAAHIAIPEMVLTQEKTGAVAFVGQVSASGPLPGGSAQALQLPLDGSWSSGGGLAVWRRCTTVGFAQLSLASLALEKRSLTLCPSKGAPIVRQDARGLRIAAGIASLDLVGKLANTPIRLKSGPVGFAYPGVMKASAVDVALGPHDSANDFRISNLVATFGREISGRFDDADVKLFSVPLDLLGASGAWQYADGILTLADGHFRLEDRAAVDRFNPLIADGATLTLRDNVIHADASLREPQSQREVTEVAIVHNLSTASGHADLAVNDLKFDRKLQPDRLTDLALGVVANADGTIRGKGRIDWNATAVTSSGRFSTDNMDFAAAFGPVKGASGTVVFTDLLGMTTAPNQTLHIASLNPGVEVDNGSVTFTLSHGQDLSLAGGTWPFMGGTITLHPTKMRFGASEKRRYVFEIVGLDAGQFIQRMELENISATGTFDGTVPIVFDENGVGRIDHGMLIARAPGGNLSYLGELTYKDKGAIANFAFDALKSLDYHQMILTMEGNLTGEIITHVSLDGVRQGDAARKNFLTRKVASLPIRFNVNISAPFYQLITSIKAMYDPASVRDPREIGLLTSDGKRLKRIANPPPPATKPTDLIRQQPPVQPDESENRP